MRLVSHGFSHEVWLHVSLDLAGGQIPSMKLADLSPIVHAPKRQPDFEGVSIRGGSIRSASTMVTMWPTVVSIIVLPLPSMVGATGLGVVAAFLHHGSEHLAGGDLRTIACGPKSPDTNLVVRLFQSFYAIETLGVLP